MRYAYLKYGNVVHELELVGPEPGKVTDSGPTTFIENFLQMVGKDPGLLISFGEKNGTKVIRNIEAVTYKRPTGALKLFAAIGTVRKLFLRLSSFKPDVIICVQDGIGLWSSYVICRIHSIPLIHSRQRAIRVRGDKLRRRFIAMIDGYVLRRASMIICHGPFTRDQLRGIGVSDSKIIEYDVQFDKTMMGMRDCSQVESGDDDRRFRIIFLGRVEESKGVYELFQACQPLLEKRKDVELVYVGDGYALEELKRRAAKTNFKDRISFTGRVPHKEIGKQLCEAGMLVTPTRFGLEGWPMAALEGLAMGVPVVAPNSGPFPFMIKDGENGLLYESDSVGDLARKIEALLDSPELRRQLAKGATRWETTRSASVIRFGDALKTACARSMPVQET